MHSGTSEGFEGERRRFLPSEEAEATGLHCSPQPQLRCCAAASGSSCCKSTLLAYDTTMRLLLSCFLIVLPSLAVAGADGRSGCGIWFGRSDAQIQTDMP